MTVASRAHCVPTGGTSLDLDCAAMRRRSQAWLLLGLATLAACHADGGPELRRRCLERRRTSGERRDRDAGRRRAELPAIQHSGVTWYAHDPSAISEYSGQKYIADGAGGWLAWVHRDLAFVISLPIVEFGGSGPHSR